MIDDDDFDRLLKPSITLPFDQSHQAVVNMDVSSGSAESMAQKTFEIDNDVQVSARQPPRQSFHVLIVSSCQTIDANDALFQYDEAQQKAIDADAPWSRE